MASPLEIRIALHYQCRMDDYGKGNGDDNFNAPAVQSALKRFVNAGLLNHHPGESKDYSGTDGLKLYVELLTAIPFPVRTWRPQPMTSTAAGDPPVDTDGVGPAVYVESGATRAVADAAYKVIAEGAAARREGKPCPYVGPGSELRAMLHGHGWLCEDLRIGLMRARPSYAADQAAYGNGLERVLTAKTEAALSGGAEYNGVPLYALTRVELIAALALVTGGSNGRPRA